MSEIDFLVGETVAEVCEDYRIAFDASAEAERRLYADVVGSCVCLDADGEPLAFSGLIGRRVASTSTANGVLKLTFTDGAALLPPPAGYPPPEDDQT